MNTTPHTLKLASLLAVGMLTLPYLAAQSSDGTDASSTNSTNSPSCRWHHDRGDWKDFHSILTAQERQELETARSTAISQNPTLKQNLTAAEESLKSAEQAVKSAMVQTDPNVQAILDKIAAARAEHESDHSKQPADQPTQDGGN